ncbi:autotransporter outer membrane beta-barrel domain-containing protein [Frateuria hangzhouensis]|uniref:autotransporter outer membrane beta-barrel domain-containing protein n=1 Tax=Frateuria hangzhouensis TaxID=2995589 RepID=UPI0022610186|nr:autotransporter domain-containing protein [Frateuria sp. STR12]MCX7514740.1 autotransporter domain-containing protein [Frateuria sp. STR12]
MFDKKQGLRPCAMAFAVALALGLSGCGGGGGGGGANVRPSPTSPPPPSGPEDTGGFSGGEVNVGSGQVTVWSDDITGSIDLVKVGAGTLVLAGTNSYGEGTTIKDGTLQIGNGGKTGSITGDVIDNSSLVFNRSDDLTFNGIVSGSGSLEQAGKGRLILTGTNTYTGGTTISHGTLQLGDGGKTGSIVGDVTDNGALVFKRSDDVTFGGVVSGTGALVQAGMGTLTLTGTNTYAGGTTIAPGSTLRLQGRKDGAGGSIIGRVLDNGTLEFAYDDHAEFDGVISGIGGLVKSGTGSVRLSGDNTYTGDTRVKAGELWIGSGGLSGSLAGDVVIDNGASLVFARYGEITYNEAISGDGTLELYDGTLTLDGDNSGFTGISRTDGNTLIVGSKPGAGAELGGTVVVDGVLGGYGSVGNVTVRTYGALAPGSSTHLGTAGAFGTLTVNGDLTLQGGSFVNLNLGAPSASPGVFGGSDNIHVNGDLSINGATLKVSDVGDMGPGLYNVITYTGTLSQNYGGLITAPVPPKQQFTVQYVDGQVNLLVEPNPAIAFWAPNGPLSLGGSGTWTSTSASWTNVDGSAPLGPMKLQPGFAEFQGAPGTVTVDESAGAINVTGMQFFVDGYTLAGKTAGDRVTLIKNSTGHLPVIEVGDGTAGSANDTAIVSAVLEGTDGMIKSGHGTLVLTGDNTIDGEFQINGGAVELAGGGLPNVDRIRVDNLAGIGAALRINAGVVIDAPVDLFRGAVLDNYGEISWAVTGVDTATINNGGGGKIIDVGGGTPVQFYGAGTLINRGTGSTISALKGGSGHGATFSNKPGIVINADGASINGPDGGVALYGGGKITNEGAGSRIFDNDPVGSDAGIRIEGGPGTVDNSAGASISGYYFGVAMYGGGQVTNDGVGSKISSEDYGWGVQVGGGKGTVVNTNGAVISGALGGVALARGGSVINGAGSLIEALSSGEHDCNDFNNCAIHVSSRYENYGGPLTLVNAGRIAGNVQMDPDASNTVTLTAGGSIEGNLDIGTRTASTLTLNGDSGTSQSYSQAVTGATTFRGSLIKDGDGEWTIDNGGLSFITGTTVNGGTLKATGTLPGDVKVNASGKLEGVPRVAGNLSAAGTVTVLDGDTRVGGNYAQAASGKLAVSLGSRLDVAGNAKLGGGALEVTGADSGYVSNSRTEVLSAAGGVSGTFDQLVKDTGVVFTATTINYDANSVWLDTTGLDVTTAAAGDGVSYTTVSMASAQRVQGAFEQLDAKIAAGKLSDVSGDFLQSAGQFQQAPTVQAAQASLESLSGQLHAVSAAMTFKAIDASGRVLSDRFDGLLDNRTGFGMWTDHLDVGGDMARDGFAGINYHLSGWLVGSDRQVGRSGVAGFAFGQSRGQQRMRQGFDHDDSRSTEAMVYAGWLNGRWYMHGRVGFGRFRQDVSRRILLGYDTQGVGTRYNGSYRVAYGESGLRFGRGHSSITPFVDVQYAGIDRDGFAEQGAGGFGLRSDAQALGRWEVGLGIRAGHHWDLGGNRALDFGARAQWQRTLASHGDVFDASFVGMEQWQPLIGVGLSRYRGVVGVGLDATLSAHTALKFSYDREMGQRDNAQMMSARLSVAF